jgi:hypothetical protein
MLDTRAVPKNSNRAKNRIIAGTILNELDDLSFRLREGSSNNAGDG